MKHIEDLHQEAIIKWAKFKLLPDLYHITSNSKVIDFLYAIPNGGKRNKNEAARLKRQGVKAGVSDLHLALPMNGCHGLWLEMKRPIITKQAKPKISTEQQIWLDRMRSVGFEACVCYGWQEAKVVIEKYLSISQLQQNK